MTHQMEEDDVLPYVYSAWREGASWRSSRLRFLTMPSMTARPPAWMQKWSMPRLKSGTYGLTYLRVVTLSREGVARRGGAASQSGARVGGTNTTTTIQGTGPALVVRRWTPQATALSWRVCIYIY